MDISTASAISVLSRYELQRQNFAVSMVKQQAENQKAVVNLVQLAVDQGKQYSQQGLVTAAQVGSQLNTQA